MSCMVLLFVMLTNGEIRHQARCEEAIADDQLIILRGLWGNVWVNILTLSPPERVEPTDKVRY